MPNPFVLTREQALLLSPHELAVAQYELLLASVSLLFATFAFVFLFCFLRWILPKFWYLRREAE